MRAAVPRAVLLAGVAVLLGSTAPPVAGVGRFVFGQALPAETLLAGPGCDGRPMASTVIDSAVGEVWVQAMASLTTGRIEEIELSPVVGQRTADFAACRRARDAFATGLGGGAVGAGSDTMAGAVWSSSAEQGGQRRLLARWFPGGGSCEVTLTWTVAGTL